MRPTPPRHFSAATHRAIVHAAIADTIEWEELPSLAGSLSKRLARRASVDSQGANDAAFTRLAAWDNTLPAALDPAPPSQPFREQLSGLATREVLEPDVFRHFFGPDAGER